MRLRIVGFTSLVSAAVLTSLAGFGSQSVSAAQPMTYDRLSKMQKRLVSGFASTEIDMARGALPAKQARPAQMTRINAAALPFYQPRSAAGCTYQFGSNRNMDTDCQNVTDADLQGRGQAQN